MFAYLWVRAAQNLNLMQNSVDRHEVTLSFHPPKFSYQLLSWVSESHSVMSNSLQPMDYTVHGILQARILEWVSYCFSRWSSLPRYQTQVFHIAGKFFTTWATKEATFLGVALNTSYPQRRVKVICISSTDLGNFRDLRGTNCFYPVDTGTQVIILPRPTKEGSSHSLLMKIE